MSKPREIWKPVPEWETYQVSNLGRVIGPKGKKSFGSVTSHGYRQFTLIRGKTSRSFRVHRLVMRAFVGYSELEVNHKNGIKADNRLSNLEYVTRHENRRHAVKTGLWKPKKGSKNGTAKLQEIDVYAIRILLAYEFRNCYLKELFGVSNSTIDFIKRDKLWKHVKNKDWQAFKEKIK